jgi:glutamyl-tRNA synthetase
VLTDADRAAKEAEGVAPHWRFKLDHGEAIEWADGIRGPQHFEPAQLGDPVVRRADGSWLYMLPSAVDDIAMGVTDVLRGEDHVSNTALQLQMFTALGAAPPRFAHQALLVGSEGKLSKRLGSLSCDALRDSAIEPEAIVALLARLGTSQPVEPIAERQTLIETFDLASFGRAPARFDEAEWRGSMRRSSTSCRSHRLPRACPRGWARRHGRPSGRISSASPTRASGGMWSLVRSRRRTSIPKP